MYDIKPWSATIQVKHTKDGYTGLINEIDEILTKDEVDEARKAYYESESWRGMIIVGWNDLYE